MLSGGSALPTWPRAPSPSKEKETFKSDIVGNNDFIDFKLQLNMNAGY